MKVAIYTRVAGFHPHDRGGHERQEQDCRQFAEERGWDVVDVFSDTGVSRGERRRMLVDAADGEFDVVLAWDRTRLARTPNELAEAMDSGARIVTANGLLDTARPADAFIARMATAYPTEPVAEERAPGPAEVLYPVF